MATKKDLQILEKKPKNNAQIAHYALKTSLVWWQKVRKSIQSFWEIIIITDK